MCVQETRVHKVGHGSQMDRIHPPTILDPVNLEREKIGPSENVMIIDLLDIESGQTRNESPFQPLQCQMGPIHPAI